MKGPAASRADGEQATALRNEVQQLRRELQAMRQRQGAGAGTPEPRQSPTRTPSESPARRRLRFPSHAGADGVETLAQSLRRRSGRASPLDAGDASDAIGPESSGRTTDASEWPDVDSLA